MGVFGTSIARQSRGRHRRRGADGSTTVTQAALAIRAYIGDPDGVKAKAASERSRHAEPMHLIDRQWNYLEQTGRGVLTPRQTRRQAKKMRRQGWDTNGPVQA